MRKFLVWFSAALIRLVGSTLRVAEDDGANILRRPDHPPLIYAFWHNRVGLIPYFYERDGSGRSLFVFISLSRDGQFITDVAERFGVKAVRGSSSRKGTKAALEAVRAARDPHADIAITPDGPRGPRYQIQPGLLRLAQATGRPIVAVTYHLKWKRELRSWDRFQVPLPFSPCTLVTRGPITVPEDATDEELVAINAKVAEALGLD
jgi:lysophospholipid acyltransferase (LPLAT)-like uncharacterized protein